jgi:lipid A 4'-phosphatase
VDAPPANRFGTRHNLMMTTSTPNTDLLRPIWLCLAGLVLSSAIFVIFPRLDLAISGAFYTPGKGFVGQQGPIVALRNFGIGITWVTCLGLAAVAVWWRLSPNSITRWPSARPWTDWLFITAGMALGPGILVNLLMKPIWGRARPRQITEFGGLKQFTPAWVPTNQCDWGCSFVSGEAAASAFILAFYFIVPARWRTATLITGILITLAISFARIAAGGHFLSDVVTAWFLILLMVLVLHAQLYHGALLGPLKRWWPLAR